VEGITVKTRTAASRLFFVFNVTTDPERPLKEMRIERINWHETHVVSSIFWRQHERRPWTSFPYDSAPLEPGAVKSSMAFNEGNVGPTRSDWDISSLRSSIEDIVEPNHINVAIYRPE